MTTQLPRDFKGIWIPREIWLDDRLSLLEKCLAVEIDSLDCGEDHCYAQNDHFIKLFNSNASTVAKSMARLNKLGYWSLVSFDGRTRIIKSNLKTTHGLFDRADLSKSTGQTCLNRQGGSRGDFIEPEIPIKVPVKKEEKEESRLAPPPPSPLFSEGKVRMSLEKKEALEKEFGEARVREVIEDLKEYAEINPKKFNAYGCHGTVVRNWIRRDAKNGKSSSMGGSLDRNREWARIVSQKYTHKEIEAGQDSIGFLAGNYPFYIKYTEHGFKEQVISRLRKMGLNAEGL